MDVFNEAFRPSSGDSLTERKLRSYDDQQIRAHLRFLMQAHMGNVVHNSQVYQTEGGQECKIMEVSEVDILTVCDAPVI